MKIFRYFSFKRAYEILRDKQLYAYSIEEVNDPFEFCPNIDSDAYKGNNLKKFLLKKHIIKQYYEKKFISIYKTYKVYEEWHLKNIDKLVEQEEVELLKNVPYSKENFPKVFSNQWKIICCSKINNSILMWSHYTKNHTGIVMEFDTDNEHIKKLGDYVVQVKYNKERPTYFHLSNIKIFEKSILSIIGTKYKDWKYEKEIRLVIPREYLKQDKYYDISNKTIKSIYLGLKISNDDRDRVFNLIKQNEYSHIDIFQAKSHESEYALEFTKLNL